MVAWAASALESAGAGRRCRWSDGCETIAAWMAHNRRMSSESIRHTQPAANDPSIDPVLTLILRYTKPVALIGIAFALSAIAWALSL